MDQLLMGVNQSKPSNLAVVQQQKASPWDLDKETLIQEPEGKEWSFLRLFNIFFSVLRVGITRTHKHRKKTWLILTQIQETKLSRSELVVIVAILFCPVPIAQLFYW